ncbi:Uncharacterised protein [Serratia quinivorans]|nr:Uncharacterised protein [Serratia quinivorans]
MDTVEQLNGIYFYARISNLSVGKLHFWLFLDTVNDQLGITDVIAVAGVILGQPNRPTRSQFAEATKVTSIASAISQYDISM